MKQTKKSSTPITPFRLSPEARKELERSSKEGGNERGSMTEVVEDRILGKDRFNPQIEKTIAEYCESHNCGRDRAIEGLIIEALALRAANSGKSEKEEFLRLAHQMADEIQARRSKQSR